METVGHVLRALAISTAEDRLPNIMDDQHESLASIYDYQNCGGGTGVWQDHTHPVLFREDRMSVTDDSQDGNTNHVSGLTTLPKDPSTVAQQSFKLYNKKLNHNADRTRLHLN